jgi:hypothetical protein
MMIARSAIPARLPATAPTIVPAPVALLLEGVPVEPGALVVVEGSKELEMFDSV